MSIGKKAIAIILISAFFFGVTSATAAKTLDVRKVAENGDNIKVGDEVAILLQFKNLFKQAIPIQIVDQNVFGNNGLDIKCLEYTLPAKEESVIAYSEPIVPFKPGKYTLDAAKVTYTNPETGKHETVESNTLDIEVNANNSQPLGQQAQGITTIYQCNGTNIHFIFDKYLKKTGREEIQPQPIAVESAQSVDHVGEARIMIEEAEDLFRNDREKDAYEKISKAIRFYFSYKLGIERELLNSELMNALKGKADADTCSKVNECLDLCGMVEFAKYKTNREDFGKLVEMAKGVIV